MACAKKSSKDDERSKFSKLQSLLYYLVGSSRKKFFCALPLLPKAKFLVVSVALAPFKIFSYKKGDPENGDATKRDFHSLFVWQRQLPYHHFCSFASKD